LAKETDFQTETGNLIFLEIK